MNITSSNPSGAFPRSTLWQRATGSVRVLPERGRVLNIEVDGHEALWVPDPPPHAWCLGGERLWFGPEADWHWLKIDKPDFDNYKVSPGLDPDLWTVDRICDGFFCASMDVELRSPHRDVFVKLQVSRSVELLPDDILATRANGIALRTHTELNILDGTPGQPVDFWSLLQVPQDSHMLIPTVGRAVPRDYFEPTPAGEFAIHPTHVEIRIRGVASFKLGISPGHATGSTANVRRVGNGHLVLVRSFPVHPELQYCDSPLAAPDTQGDALQFYCDDGSLGAFGELEHRTPALRVGVGPQKLTETAITRVMLFDDASYTVWKARYIGS